MFIWDEGKNQTNIKKHGVSFKDATQAFNDPNRITLYDEGHSQSEERYFCIGKVHGEVLTVRFVIRGDVIRIIGAGYWRKGRQIYDSRD